MVAAGIAEGYWLSREQAVQLSDILYKVRPCNTKPYDLWILPGQGLLAQLAEAVDGWVMEDVHHVSHEDRAESWRPFTSRARSVTAFSRVARFTAGYQPVATLRWTQGDTCEHLRSSFYFRKGWGESAFEAMEERYCPDWTRTWSIDTLVVDQSILQGLAAGMQVWGALLKTLYDLVFAHKVGWLIGIMEEGTYKKLCGMVPGIEPIGPVKYYLHGRSVPFILDIRTLQEKLDSSPVADMFRYGKGLGGLMLDEVFNFPNTTTQ